MTFLESLFNNSFSKCHLILDILRGLNGQGSNWDITMLFILHHTANI